MNAPAWVKLMNDAISTYPTTTMGSFVVLDAGSIFAAMGLYSVLGIEVSADFALAFGLSRLFRRVRMPVDIAAAAVLAKVYPPLTWVKPVQSVLAGQEREKEKQGTQPAAAEGSKDSSGGGFSLLRSVGTVVDTYGLAFMVAQRTFVGLTSVFTIYAALKAGLDVQGYLQSWEGVSGDMVRSATSAGGKWALAAVTVAPFFPGLLVGSAWLGRGLGRWRSARMA